MVYVEKEKNIAVYGEYDVIVGGGGSAGIAAALAAARCGARVLLIERNGILGGVATTGLMVSWNAKGKFWDSEGRFAKGGIPWELHNRIIDLGGGSENFKYPQSAGVKMVFEPEYFKRAVYDMIELEKEKLEVLFHTYIAGLIMEETTVKGVIIENKSGRQAVYAKQMVDTTGDADLCAWANPENKSQPCINTIMFRVGGVNQEKTYRELEKHKEIIYEKMSGKGIWESINHNWDSGYFSIISWAYSNLVCLEPFKKLFDEAIEKGIFTERQLDFEVNYQKHNVVPDEWGLDLQGIEGCAKKDIVDIWGIAAYFDGTDAKKLSYFNLLGHKISWLFFEHIVKGIPGFENSYIIDIANNFGIRHTRDVKTYFDYNDLIIEPVKYDSIGKESIPRKKLSQFHGSSAYLSVNDERTEFYFDIPFRMLVPQKVENLLVAGKPFHSLRSMPTCMMTGEAAGTAAALAAETNTTARQVDVKKLHELLRNANVII